jgi:hypothetical protein
MSSSERIAPPKRFRFTRIFSKNSATFLPGLMRKCQASIQKLLNMRSLRIQTQSLLDRNFVQLIQGRQAAIKAEVEKLLKAGFIYPIHLTEWVSNPVPVDKKQGTIRVCTDFRDLNKACPKENYPTPFIDQIIDECAGCEAFSFMDGFSGYNQIQIKPEDQHKTTFICPWGTFAYRKMPFGLKNAGATFQRAMSFAFHDLKHIVEAYLDDLASRSRKRKDHPTHL